MTRTLALIALALCAIRADAAIAYAKHAPQGAGFALEYPSDWKRSPGLETVKLVPPGRDGKNVRVFVERWPLSKSDPKTAQAYVASLEALEPVKKIEKKESLVVDGRTAQRLTLVETVELKGTYGQKLPGPLRETIVVIPLKTGFLVARIEGVGKPYDRALPEFGRLVEKLDLDPSPLPKETR